MNRTGAMALRRLGLPGSRSVSPLRVAPTTAAWPAFEPEPAVRWRSLTTVRRDPPLSPPPLKFSAAAVVAAAATRLSLADETISASRTLNERGSRAACVCVFLSESKLSRRRSGAAEPYYAPSVIDQLLVSYVYHHQIRLFHFCSPVVIVVSYAAIAEIARATFFQRK